MRLETVSERFQRLTSKYGEAAACMLPRAVQEGVEYDPVEGVWRKLEGLICPPLPVNEPEIPASQPSPSLPRPDRSVTAI